MIDFLKIILIACMTISVVNCKNYKTENKIISNTNDTLLKNVDVEKTDKIYTELIDFNDSLKLRIDEKNISIIDNEGKTLFENNNIIRLADENKNCFSEGFEKVVCKNLYFTVEQQNCSNKYFINEYITFKQNKIENRFFLHKIGYVFRDKTNGNKTEKVFDRNDFGSVDFNDINLSLLYLELINKSSLK